MSCSYSLWLFSSSATLHLAKYFLLGWVAAIPHIIWQIRASGVVPIFSICVWMQRSPRVPICWVNSPPLLYVSLVCLKDICFLFRRIRCHFWVTRDPQIFAPLGWTPYNHHGRGVSILWPEKSRQGHFFFCLEHKKRFTVEKSFKFPPIQPSEYTVQGTDAQREADLLTIS